MCVGDLFMISIMCLLCFGVKLALDGSRSGEELALIWRCVGGVFMITMMHLLWFSQVYLGDRLDSLALFLKTSFDAGLGGMGLECHRPDPLG